VVTFAGSWDVWSHGHAPMELYGEDGTVFVPDPNFFGGDVRVTRGAKPAKLPRWNHPFGIPNQQRPDGKKANYRTAGLADMALAIAEGRAHRCSLEVSLHAVEVLTGILKSSETGKPVAMQTSCERPAALGPRDASALQVSGRKVARR
jgi:predicted dehydrogenase